MGFQSAVLEKCNLTPVLAFRQRLHVAGGQRIGDSGSCEASIPVHGKPVFRLMRSHDSGT